MPHDNGLPKGWAKRSIGDVATVRFSSVDKKSVAGEKSVHLCNYMEVWKNPYIDDDMPFMEATANAREIKQ
ncbi:MAG: restriction endonuclease subunit S, partial [Dehalococcoidia bacterium]